MPCLLLHASSRASTCRPSDKDPRSLAGVLLSRQEYERLAAQLDGAKSEVTKKVNEISKAAGKEDLVEAAEEHARNLSKLAKELEK